MRRYSISFVLPMYNEQEAIEDTVEELRVIAKDITNDYEIILSDDASTDGSPEIAERLAKEDTTIKLVRLKENTKFGGALAAGLKRASKEIIIYTDSDLPVSLLDIKKALQLIDEADIVTAVSIVKKGENLKRKIISWGYNFLLRILFGLEVRDVNSGLKIFKKETLAGMEYMSKSPFVDAEIFIKAKKNGARIKEYPLIFRPRRQGVSKVARISVITQTFMDMLKFRVSK